MNNLEIKMRLLRKIFSYELYDSDASNKIDEESKIKSIIFWFFNAPFYIEYNDILYLDAAFKKLSNILGLDESKINFKYVTDRISIININYNYDAIVLHFIPDNEWIDSYKKLLTLIKK